MQCSLKIGLNNGQVQVTAKRSSIAYETVKHDVPSLSDAICLLVRLRLHAYGFTASVTQLRLRLRNKKKYSFAARSRSNYNFGYKYITARKPHSHFHSNDKTWRNFHNVYYEFERDDVNCGFIYEEMLKY
jgi:hypothetical protein